jgi:prevent-host-death family protein
MNGSTQISPISYLKAKAAEIVRELARHRGPMTITRNGEAWMVIQDVASYEETQVAFALLRIPPLGRRQIEKGKVIPAKAALQRIRRRTPRD